MSEIRLDIYRFQQPGLQNLLSKILLRAENTNYSVGEKLRAVQLDLETLSQVIALYQFHKQHILWPRLKACCGYDLTEVIESNSELEVELQELSFLVQSITPESSALQGIMFYARFVAFKTRYFMQMEIEALALGPLIDKYFSYDDLLSMYEQMIKVLPPAKVALLFRTIIPVVDIKVRITLLSIYKKKTSTSRFNQVLNQIRTDLPRQSIAGIKELML